MYVRAYNLSGKEKTEPKIFAEQVKYLFTKEQCFYMRFHFSPSKIDTFRGKRTTDRGTTARPCQSAFANGYLERGYVFPKNPAQVKAALKQFQGTQLQIANQALRIAKRRKGFISREKLVSATLAMIATKHPSVSEAKVRGVILALSTSKGLTQAQKRVE